VATVFNGSWTRIFAKSVQLQLSVMADLGGKGLISGNKKVQTTLESLRATNTNTAPTGRKKKKSEQSTLQLDMPAIEWPSTKSFVCHNDAQLFPLSSASLSLRHV